MPFVQIIPYVADQFDPGSYVFDGGTFDSKTILEGNDNIGVFDFSESAFDSSNVFQSLATNIGVYVPSDATFDSSQILDSRVIILVEGVNWDASANVVELTSSSVLVTEVDWDASANIVNSDNTVFTEVVEGDVQNSLDYPASRPLIIDSGTSVNKAVLESPLYSLESVYTTTAHSEITGTIVDLIPDNSASNGNLESVIDNYEVTEVADGNNYMFVDVDSGNLSSATVTPIVSLITQSELQGTSNNPEFTM